MHARRRFLRATPLALLPMLSGCGEILGDIASACIDFDGPEFATATLPAATVGRAYAATIEVELVREPFDDSYAYRFRLRGSLPPGLDWQQSGQGRRIQISGTPTQAGNYAFSIQVSVTDPLASPTAPPALCWTDNEQGFQIMVAS